MIGLSRNFTFLWVACAVVMGCSSYQNPGSHHIIRDCHTQRGAMRKCIVQYYTKPDGPVYYQYFFRAKELEGTVFEYLEQDGKLE